MFWTCLGTGFWTGCRLSKARLTRLGLRQLPEQATLTANGEGTMAENIGFGPGLICAGHGSPRMTGWPSGVGGAIGACEGGLTRPDLADALPAATVLDAEPLARVAGRARSLHGWLTTQGYTDLHCEIPVLAHTPEGAEIPGTLDLLATGPQGALLIDHKPGGSGTDLGPYWSQLSAYVNVINQTLPACNLRGAAVFWIDHGRL